MTRPPGRTAPRMRISPPTKREIVIDTETMSLDPLNGHRVVEIEAVELINRSDVAVRCQSNHPSPLRDLLGHGRFSLMLQRFRRSKSGARAFQFGSNRS